MESFKAPLEFVKPVRIAPSWVWLVNVFYLFWVNHNLLAGYRSCNQLLTESLTSSDKWAILSSNAIINLLQCTLTLTLSGLWWVTRALSRNLESIVGETHRIGANGFWPGVIELRFINIINILALAWFIAPSILKIINFPSIGNNASLVTRILLSLSLTPLTNLMLFNS